MSRLFCKPEICIELTIFSLQRREKVAKTLLSMELKTKFKCLSSHSHFSHILCCIAFNSLLKMVYSAILPLSDTIFPHRIENLRTQLAEMSNSPPSGSLQ